MNGRKGPSPFHIEQFANIARRLEEERRAAAADVEHILRDTPRSEWPSLAELPALRTAGALERLGRVVADFIPRDPNYARAVAEVAVAAAEGIGAHAYPAVVLAQLRAHAWKDFGKALRFLGLHAQSIDALKRGEEQIASFGACAHDLAIVRFNLAVTLQEIDRHGESLALLSECKTVFRMHGDTRLLVLCGLAEGVLLQRLRKYREARETYLLLLASTREIEKESLAAIHHAVGFCSIELGDFEAAEANLMHAISLYGAIGHSLQALKCELGRGRLFIRRGDWRQGILHLRPIRRRFLSHGMHEEAGLCGLEIVEAMLLLSRFSEAETLARKILGEFTIAGLNTRAITALGYLTETIAAREASPTLATDVREYILSLRAKPEREFVRHERHARESE